MKRVKQIRAAAVAATVAAAVATAPVPAKADPAGTALFVGGAALLGLLVHASQPASTERTGFMSLSHPAASRYHGGEAQGSNGTMQPIIIAMPASALAAQPQPQMVTPQHMMSQVPYNGHSHMVMAVPQQGMAPGMMQMQPGMPEAPVVAPQAAPPAPTNTQAYYHTGGYPQQVTTVSYPMGGYAPQYMPRYTTPAYAPQQGMMAQPVVYTQSAPTYVMSR